MLNVIRNPYVLLGIVVLGVTIYALGYYKGGVDKENYYLKKDIGKGVENNEILANRPDDAEFFRLLEQGKF